MSSSDFLIIDQQPISLDRVLEYLQVSGQLQPFLLEILYQHVLAQAVKSQVIFSPTEFEQRLIEFRLDYQLTDADKFQEWLVDRGIDYETFRQQFAWGVSVEVLKHQICQPRLQAVFLHRKSSFDQVVLSWIRVNTQAEAQSLQQQIAAGEEFEQLAAKYVQSVEIDNLQRSQHPDRVALREILTWEELPQALQTKLQGAHPEEVIDLVAIDDDWYLVRLEDWLPAELNDDLKEQLADEIFEQWLTEKVEELSVQLLVN